MPNIKLYFSHALLLLTFTCPLWQVNQSSPVPLMTDSCVLDARSLLWNITNVLTAAQNNLFKGINCPEQTVELNMQTRTAEVCAAKGSMCSGVTKSEFDLVSCLTNIGDDLFYYKKNLTAQPDPENLLSPTLFSLQVLMENCFPLALSNLSKDSPLKQDNPDHQLDYDQRLHLCKVLRGFHVRTITISRVIGYIHSGDHNK